ncbi:MAG: hypothetical protein HY585_03340, partial [Candidatus Omnitrophica bacterium]|nr:hypothetical protein [Candidatus Omnitrophota bacterium]
HGMDSLTRDAKKRGGFALVFSIFLVVGLQTIIAGNMVGMMRHSREVQRVVDHTKVFWVAESGIDRTIHEIRTYLATYGELPPAEDETQEITPIMTAVETWYRETFKANFTDALGDIALDVNVRLESLDEVFHVAVYRVTSDAVRGQTQVSASLTQFLEVPMENLDNSCFSDEDMELTAGPTSAIQGPCFSNKNVYLMNDNGSTLSLSRADDFSSPANRNPYVLHSAGHIYFYFKRAVAENYLLDKSKYAQLAPSYYRDAPGGLELFPLRLLISPAEYSYAPRLYYMANDNGLASASGGNTDPITGTWSTDNNFIETEDINGNFVMLTPRHPEVRMSWPNSNVHLDRPGAYTYPADYNSIRRPKVNISTGFDPAAFPKALPGWSPQNPVSTDPLTNPNWPGDIGSGMVMDGQPSKIIPVGHPNLGTHVILEPVLGTDSDTVKKFKLQFQARDQNFGFDLHCLNPMSCMDPSEQSADLAKLIDEGVAQFTQLVDYRMEAPLNALEINVGELMALLETEPNLVDDPNRLLIYVETRQPAAFSSGAAPVVVVLVNGEKLPKDGFSVATNGRLWIKGDYNIFDYSDGKNRNCTAEEWDNRECKVPPAAIFSDSFGVLSKDWRDSYTLTTPLSARPLGNTAASDVIVNVAMMTGNLRSQLVPKYDYCLDDMSNCNLMRPEDAGFVCTNGLNSDGSPKNKNKCEYKKNLDGIYLINRQSDNFKEAWGNRYKGGEIPIFVDALNRAVPVRPFPGIYFARLDRYEVFRRSPQGQQCTYQSITGCNQYGPPVWHPPNNEDQQGWWENGPCVRPRYTQYTAPCTVAGVYYFQNYYHDLYEPKQSGGLENLVNLQENWQGRTLRYSGTLTFLWYSQNLILNGEPKFWGDYYNAPSRKFDYNEDFKSNPPPAIKTTFSIKRQRWTEN